MVSVIVIIIYEHIDHSFEIRSKRIDNNQNENDLSDIFFFTLNECLMSMGCET